MKKLMVVFGTRPEALKMVPVIKRLSCQNEIELKICVTSQHKELLHQVLEIFNIKADYDLEIMRNEQSLNAVTSLILRRLQPILKNFKPDLIIVHGDTASALSASLAALYERIPIAHIEAGLRSNKLYSPWPEEANRRLIASIATYHFAPTSQARKNLIKENINPENIWVTGNTIIDTLLMAKDVIKKDCILKDELQKKFNFLSPQKKLIVVTTHRRENIENNIKKICLALIEIVRFNSNIQIIYSVHPNPIVKDIIKKYLSKNDNIFLITPVDYFSFLYLMEKSDIILTDSCGIQEEAPSLNKPVLILREATERTESLNLYGAKLIGTNTSTIVQESLSLLENPNRILRNNPYGDGEASKKIVTALNHIKLKLKS